jgi:nucleoid DNA-binding protein
MCTTKAQLINFIAKEADLSKAKGKQAIDLTLWETSKALDIVQDVTKIGFDSMKIHKGSERLGINPKTGAKIKIAFKKNILFIPENHLFSHIKYTLL